MNCHTRAKALGALLGIVLVAVAADALEIEVQYGDQPGEGFFDPTLGELRRVSFETAIDRWREMLAGPVPIVVSADMSLLGGTGASALLASTGAVSLHRRFEQSRQDTWYAAALANQLSGRDLNGSDFPEITVTFNAEVDGPEVLGSVDWYYGLDGQPGADIDFLTIALHEIGHGLGFLDTIDGSNGAFPLDDQPAILERMLVRPEIGVLGDLLQAERLAAIISPGDLVWNGPAVVAFNGAPLSVFSPEPFQDGSSLAHWNANLPNAELMQPFYSGPDHDLGALLPALADMGWELGVSPTPRSPEATPTSTRRPRPTPAAEIPVAKHEKVYVTNFDDDTVSVIDPEAGAVVRTVAVDAGPLGVAASPDGTRIYVGFHAGTLSVLRTGDDQVIARVPAGESPNGVAVTPDGVYIVVTDTVADRVAIVAAENLEVRASVPGGQQPSGLALDGSGRLAFTSNFSGATVTVVDLDAQRRRAIVQLPFSTPSDGILGIAIAPATGQGYVTSVYGSWARSLQVAALRSSRQTSPFTNGARPEAVVTDAAGNLAYFIGHDIGTGTGRLSVVRMEDDEILTTILVGPVPEALALSPDETDLYVANTGSNNVSVVDTTTRRAVGLIRVGRAPMGIAAVMVPEGQCPEACETPTPTGTSPSTPTSTPSLTPTNPTPVRCAGDCDGDRTVLVNELVA